MAADLGPNPRVSDLLSRPLIVIHTEARHWSTWFEAAGLTFDGTAPYMVVDTLAVALEMALNGEAIALVNGPFVDQDMAAGKLTRPVEHTATCPGAWGLICRKELKDSGRIKTFMDWIIADTMADRTSAVAPRDTAAWVRSSRI